MCLNWFFCIRTSALTSLLLLHSLITLSGFIYTVPLPICVSNFKKFPSFISPQICSLGFSQRIEGTLQPVSAALDKFGFFSSESTKPKPARKSSSGISQELERLSEKVRLLGFSSGSIAYEGAKYKDPKNISLKIKFS